MVSDSGSLTPAQQLLGKTLANGWMVVEHIPRHDTATGGFFSQSYIARSKAGDHAFVKALDYQRALNSPDPAKTLLAMTNAYVFEKELLARCKRQQLSRIVRVLDSGKLPATSGEPSSVVEYLIFECAQGDIRSFIETGKTFETAWALRTIHQAAAALQQLHSIKIAHQDIKPSNLLVFDNTHSKLADLGRASFRGGVSPYDDLNVAGDLAYAPPELLYEHTPPDWQTRRLGCDMYLLGSLVVFFCTSGFSMTPLLLARLSEKHHYKNWSGSYSEVLPYLLHAFTQVIRDLRANMQQEYADRIAELVNQLCYPNPSRRGHPKNIVSTGNQYSLERFVSILGNLASRAEYSLKRHFPLKATK